MSTQPFTLQTSAEYWSKLEAVYQQARQGDHIAMMVMSMDPSEPITARILRELKGAAMRGAEVHLIIDAYNFLIHTKNDTPGPLWWSSKMGLTWGRYRRMLAIIRDLRATPNFSLTIINMPSHAFTNPKSGRSHIKFTVLNDQVFIGGCNLESTDWLDAMLSWHDQKIADYLFNLVLDLEHTPSTKQLLKGTDRAIPLDEHTSLLIDAGKKHQSVIFDEAMKLIDNAQDFIVMTCQYFPHGATAQHLVAAQKRGVHVQIIYGHPVKQGFIGSLIQHASATQERLRVPRELFRDRLPKNGPGIHGKLLATEKGAIIGSNNYVYAGVMFGTAEMAVMRHDPTFAADVVKLVEQLVEGTPITLRR